ncbi:hypothetical protein [Tomitella cavernea]|uniref:Integral membrane protein n=1 Tax=Tomitella cavernea TaxID=1387982 RepID=A0ABP9CNT0_9ACTN|nr:hypothetical protein [Tomitella cavernea]
MGWGIERTPVSSRVLRGAVIYGATVVIGALIVLAVTAAMSWGRPVHCDDGTAGCLSAAQYVMIYVPPAIIALGGITAFIRTLLVWRRRGPWMVWLGVGWFLFAVMLVFVASAGGALMG